MSVMKSLPFQFQSMHPIVNCLLVYILQLNLILNYLSVKFQPMSLSVSSLFVRFHSNVSGIELSVCPATLKEANTELSTLSIMPRETDDKLTVVPVPTHGAVDFLSALCVSASLTISI